MTRDDHLLLLARVLSPLPDSEAAAAALREDIARGALPWEQLVELASRQLVSPGLYRGFADKGLLLELPAELRSYLEAVHELNGERNRRLAEQALEVVATLNAAGIEPALVKGVAYLLADLHRDPAARVIGDIDLLVTAAELPAAIAALAAAGYRQAGLEDFSFAAHHHHTPLARNTGVAAVELHTEPLPAPFAGLLPAARLRRAARRIEVGGRCFRLPACMDQVVHNIVHAQLADRHYWLARVPLRPLVDLARLRLAGDDRINWRALLAAFDRAGYGSACRAWLMTAERLLGQALPAGVTPDLGARLACWRQRHQSRHPWLRVAGESYGYHRAMLAELSAGPAPRRRLLARLLHPNGYRRYARALRAHRSRAL